MDIITATVTGTDPGSRGAEIGSRFGEGIRDAVDGMTTYTASMAFQSIGIPIRRIPSAIIIGVLGTFFTIYLVMSTSLLDAVNIMLQELILQNPAPEAAETVTPALSFGLEPEVGVLSEYARADHSHGTPTLPDLAGDVIGDIAANTVVALRNRAISTTAPQVGDVLALDNTQQWSPTHLPVASDQLPAALAFGGAGAPGANADYARRDHVHPLPALPELAGDTQGPIATNKVRALQGTPVADTAPTLGQVLMFQEVAAPGPGPASRPRRVWVPANLPTPETPELPPLGGDVSGDAKDNRIDLLQGNKVAADAPKKGDVLTYNGEAWVAAAGATGGSTSPVEVVAAGVAQVLISSGQIGRASCRERV